jgi:hypothetical protein
LSINITTPINSWWTFRWWIEHGPPVFYKSL